MKNKLGYYVLSKKDTKALHAAIEKTFEFDVANSMTMHPMVTHPGYLHIDVLVGEKKMKLYWFLLEQAQKKHSSIFLVKKFLPK